MACHRLLLGHPCRSLWIAGLILSVVSPLPLLQAQSKSPFRERLIPLSVVPKGWTVATGSFLASPDATRVAVKVSRDGGGFQKAVMVDQVLNEVGPVSYGPVFSLESNQVAMVSSHGGQGLLNVNGVKTSRTPDPVAEPVFSPDGQRVAYIGRAGSERLVYVDGRSGTVCYDEILSDSLFFSPDSKHFAFVARRGDAWFVVVNGQEGSAYAQVAAPVFSPNSQRFAYWAMNDARVWVMVTDGQENPLVTVRKQAGLSFSPDSSQLVGFGRRHNRWHVITDDRFDEGHDALGLGSLTFSPDSRHIAYAAMDDGRWTVVVDGFVVGDFEGLLAGSFRFSGDSSRLGYVAKGPDGWFAMINNDKHRPFDHISAKSLQFSPDSLRFAYVAKNDSERVTVVVDGYRWGICDGVEDLKFSPDSASVVWVERRGHTSRVVVDGAPGAQSFDQLVPGASLVFDDPGALHTLVYKRPGPVFFRYEAQLYPQQGYPQDDSGDDDATPMVIQAGDGPVTGP